MKKYSCHDKHYKVILFQAAVITLLFHMAMLYSFVYEPPKTGTVKHIDRQIAMFNPTDNKSGNSREIAKWLEYHNPGLISRPDNINGYGAASKRQKMRTPIKDIIVLDPSGSAVPQPKKFEFLSGGDKLKVDNSSRLIGYKTLAVRPLSATTAQPVRKISYPLLKMSNGKYIDGILTVEDLKQRKLSTDKTLGATRLQVVSSAAGIMPRIRIKDSCGITELDRLAERKILLNRKKLTAALKTGDTLFVDIIWREVKR
jgi:hypothetical protein